MRYYISDCHFYHEALNSKMDKRGFENATEMNKYMLDKWNNKVSKNDTVVILGDLSFGNAEQTKDLLDKLNGKLWLILGNHDKYLSSRDFKDLASRFDWIKHYEELHDNHRKVICCHYPIMCYNGQYHLKNDGTPKVYMLYGHVHDTLDQKLIEQFQTETRNTMKMGFDGKMHPIPSNMINCFCKYSDYEPLTLDEWIKLTEKRLGER